MQNFWGYLNLSCRIIKYIYLILACAIMKQTKAGSFHNGAFKMLRIKQWKPDTIEIGNNGTQSPHIPATAGAYANMSKTTRARAETNTRSSKEFYFILVIFYMLPLPFPTIRSEFRFSLCVNKCSVFMRNVNSVCNCAFSRLVPVCFCGSAYMLVNVILFGIVIRVFVNEIKKICVIIAPFKNREALLGACLTC